MLGEGMVSFGGAFATDFRNSKSSAKTVWSRCMRSPTAVGDEFEIDAALVGAERHFHLVLELLDAADGIFEIHEPVDAAELAIGHRLQADIFLTPHHLANRLVLDVPQLFAGDFSLRAIVTRLQ